MLIESIPFKEFKTSVEEVTEDVVKITKELP
jgi:hypothetical protein